MPSIERPMAGRITDDADVGREYRRRIGRYITKRRRDHGLTQRKLGLVVGIGNTAISHIETGRNPLPPERYEDFADALNIPRLEFGKFILEHTNPWLYVLLFIPHEVTKQMIRKIPDRGLDLRLPPAPKDWWK